MSVCPILPDYTSIRGTLDKMNVKRLQESLMQPCSPENSKAVSKLVMEISIEQRVVVCSELVMFFLKGSVYSSNPTFFEQKALLIIVSCPECCMSRLSDGNLLVHYAASLPDVPFTIWEALVTSAPKSLLVLNTFGHSVLHILADNERPTLYALRLIVSTCPEVVKIPTHNGKLPIHLLMSRKRRSICSKSMKILLNAYPESAFEEITEDIIQIQLFDSNSSQSRSNEKWSPYSRAMNSTDVFNSMQQFWSKMAQERLASFYKK